MPEFDQETAHTRKTPERVPEGTDEQLGVYPRLDDVPVPSVYGPSADENRMF